jgi:hypothetical protein
LPTRKIANCHPVGRGNPADEGPEKATTRVANGPAAAGGAEGLAGRAANKHVQVTRPQAEFPHHPPGSQFPDIRLVDLQATVARPTRVAVEPYRLTEDGLLLDAGEHTKAACALEANI